MYRFYRAVSKCCR